MLCSHVFHGGKIAIITNSSPRFFINVTRGKDDAGIPLMAFQT